MGNHADLHETLKSSYNQCNILVIFFFPIPPTENKNPDTTVVSDKYQLMTVCASLSPLAHHMWMDGGSTIPQLAVR